MKTKVQKFSESTLIQLSSSIQSFIDERCQSVVAISHTAANGAYTALLVYIDNG